MSNYVCSVSGAQDDGYDMSFSPAKADALGSAPLGWTKITIQRRVPNNQWRLIQMAKESQLRDIRASLEQAGLTGDFLELKMALAGQQQDALYFQYEKATPPFLVEEEVLWVANEEDALEPYNEARAIFALPEVKSLVDEGSEDAG